MMPFIFGEKKTLDLKWELWIYVLASFLAGNEAHEPQFVQMRIYFNLPYIEYSGYNAQMR